MLDMLQLLPHSKKDSKLDTKADRGIINEVAEMKVMLNACRFFWHSDLHMRLPCDKVLTDIIVCHAGLRQCHVL